MCDLLHRKLRARAIFAIRPIWGTRIASNEFRSRKAFSTDRAWVAINIQTRAIANICLKYSPSKYKNHIISRDMNKYTHNNRINAQRNSNLDRLANDTFMAAVNRVFAPRVDSRLFQVEPSAIPIHDVDILSIIAISIHRSIV